VPRPSVWAVRAALIHLAVGFTLGALLLANKGIGLHPALWQLLPLHREILLIGWTAQLALGVAYWILPRLRRVQTAGFEVPGSRGGQAAFAASLICLNAGELLAGITPAMGGPPQVRLAGRILEVSAGLLFAVHAWRRLRG
jgi:hypothetical protein